MTPLYTGLAMPLAVVKQNMTAQEMNAYDLTNYLDVISPLSMFLNENSQTFETPETLEHSTDSDLIALDGISTPGRTRGTLTEENIPSARSFRFRPIFESIMGTLHSLLYMLILGTGKGPYFFIGQRAGDWKRFGSVYLLAIDDKRY
jgi:hypothetical protein